MTWQTSSGASLSIGAAPPATFDEAGYAAVVPTEIGEITNIGAFGKEWALVSHQPLSKRGVEKGKGSYNNGTLNPNLAFDPNDAGQLALMAALEEDVAYPFIVELKDGTKFYFMALVMSFKPTVGSSDEVVGGTPTLEITSQPMASVYA